MGDYLATANRNIMLAVQIETEEGLENCEEIAKVDGIGKSDKDPQVAEKEC